MDRSLHDKCIALTLVLLLLFAPAVAKGATGKININTATAKELRKLPFIGSSRARAIVQYRKEHGPFTSLDELKNIPAIGLGTYEAILPRIALSFVPSREEDLFADIGGNFEVFPKIATSPGEIVMLPDSDYFKTLISSIRKARHRIDMTMFIFKTTASQKNRPAMVVNELIRARKRGVKISVILDKSDYDEGVSQENLKVARHLKKHNIDARLDSGKTTTHAKLVVIDERLSFVGSHNMTHSALSRNNEYSLMIDSRPLARELLEYIRKIR